MNTITIKEQVLFNNIKEAIAAEVNNYFGIPYNKRSQLINEIYNMTMDNFFINIEDININDEIIINDFENKTWIIKIEGEKLEIANIKFYISFFEYSNNIIKNKYEIEDGDYRGEEYIVSILKNGKIKVENY